MDEEPQSPTSKSGVRRPMNAFLIFCKRHRSLVRERNPRLDNRSVTRILGELWAKLPLEEKSTYTSLANEYKEAFLKANPDYKWFNPEKNTVPHNRDKPSLRPSNSLTSYTGQIPHTDDNGPTSPTHGLMTSQRSAMIMENKGPGGHPFSASLTAPQGAPITAQGIPIFPLGMPGQPSSLSVPQSVNSMTPAITTIAMVAGQPVMVSQTPLMVSLPQQQLTPVTMVTTHLPMGTINSTATTLSNQVTRMAGSIVTATTAADKHPQNDRGVGLFELAQMCSTEHAKMGVTMRPNQLPVAIATTQNITMATAQNVTMAPAPKVTMATSAAPFPQSQEPQDKPRLDSKVLQGQVKEALGFKFGNLDKGKEQTQNPGGVNHVLDYSLKKNKEAEMARNIRRQDAAKSFSIGQVTTPNTKPTESLQLSKLVLDHVIEAMYSHETAMNVKPPSAPAVIQPPQNSTPDQNKSKLLLTFGEIQERVIRSAVEQSDFNDLLRIKPNAATNVNQSEAGILKVKDSKPATITSDANKENKAENKINKVNIVDFKTDPDKNQKESQDGFDDCDAKKNIPIKKRKPRIKEAKQQMDTQQEPESSDRTTEDTQSSDDLEVDSNDLDAGVRKSKRSNRGRRYQELIEQGYLQPAREKGRKGDDNVPVSVPNPIPHPPIGETENSVSFLEPEGLPNKTQFSEVPQDVSTKKVKAENEAGDSLGSENPLGDDQQYCRKRTYSETDIGNRRTRKRYKTGDFDLDAQIASLPICHIDEVTRRGTKGKSLKIRHHSENSTLNKFAKPMDINLLNVAELRGVLRPRSRSMSQAMVGSARRKAHKMNIVRFIQAIRNPNASMVPLLSPVSASSIPPWSESSTPEKLGNEKTGVPHSSLNTSQNKETDFNPEQGTTKDTENPEIPKLENSTKRQSEEDETGRGTDPVKSSGKIDKPDLQEAVGKVTCVNVTAVSELRFEKGSEKTRALVTCQ